MQPNPDCRHHRVKQPFIFVRGAHKAATNSKLVLNDQRNWRAPHHRMQPCCVISVNRIMIKSNKLIIIIIDGIGSVQRNDLSTNTGRKPLMPHIVICSWMPRMVARSIEVSLNFRWNHAESTGTHWCCISPTNAFCFAFQSVRAMDVYLYSISAHVEFATLATICQGHLAE